MNYTTKIILDDVLAKEPKLTLKQAKQLQKWFYKAFPEAHKLHRKIKNDVRRRRNHPSGGRTAAVTAVT